MVFSARCAELFGERVGGVGEDAVGCGVRGRFETPPDSA